jgi:hypothetical protein
LIWTCFAAYCPSAQDLYPAKCYIKDNFGMKWAGIYINTGETVNLTAIFNKVSQDPLAIKERFASIYIENNKLVEI